MTVGVLARIIFRQWVVVVVGAFMTALMCLVRASADRTYWTSVDLVFLQPGGGSMANVSDADIPSLINFAGIVQRRVSHV